ncbi:MAG: FAD-binding protein [Dehalococcoidia bacterium]|nr:MAG: FAD-binding protein [Dehalococcoidia bacterium]
MVIYKNMKEEYDVVIIGAGPGGLSCGLELQKAKKSVLILERNKEIGPKVCAGGLTTKIKNLGLSLDIAEILFSSIKISFQRKEKIISGNNPFVATIDREKLGKIMLEKLSDSIEIKTCSEVVKIDNNFIEVNNQIIKYKYLVGADGGNSIVRKFLGLRTKKILITLQYIIPEQFKELELSINSALFGWGYAWIFPHKGYTAIGCCRDKRFLRGLSLKNSFDKWLKNKNIKVEGIDLQGGIINFDYQGFDFGNKFLVGDAAGFASGITGEGIYFAMVSGKEIAKRIIDPTYKTTEIDKILKIKHIQELPLTILPLLNSSLLSLFFKFSFFLFNFKWFRNKLFKVYS